MRVLAISGSLRRHSYNTLLLRAAGELVPAGVEVELYRGLDSIPAFSEDLEDEPPEPVADLNERIRAADAVLISTPEYNGSVPGALKNALDWASRPHGESPLVAKPVAVISASNGSFGARWAQEQLRRALMLSGSQVVDEELAVAHADEKVAGGQLADEETRVRLAGVVRALLDAAGVASEPLAA